LHHKNKRHYLCSMELEDRQFFSYILGGDEPFLFFFNEKKENGSFVEEAPYDQVKLGALLKRARLRAGYRTPATAARSKKAPDRPLRGKSIRAIEAGRFHITFRQLQNYLGFLGCRVCILWPKQSSDNLRNVYHRRLYQKGVRGRKQTKINQI